jgi:hypothetical protein
MVTIRFIEDATLELATGDQKIAKGTVMNVNEASAARWERRNKAERLTGLRTPASVTPVEPPAPPPPPPPAEPVTPVAPVAPVTPPAPPPPASEQPAGDGEQTPPPALAPVPPAAPKRGRPSQSSAGNE